MRHEPPIPAGQRNDKLFRIARGFVRHGQHALSLAVDRCIQLEEIGK
jgi:hypothetical protein